MKNKIKKITDEEINRTFGSLSAIEIYDWQFNKTMESLRKPAELFVCHKCSAKINAPICPECGMWQSPF